MGCWLLPEVNHLLLSSAGKSNCPWFIGADGHFVAAGYYHCQKQSVDRGQRNVKLAESRMICKLLTSDCRCSLFHSFHPIRQSDLHCLSTPFHSTAHLGRNITQMPTPKKGALMLAPLFCIVYCHNLPKDWLIVQLPSMGDIVLALAFFWVLELIFCSPCELLLRL